MKTIRKFAYAAVLTLSACTFMPSPAHAQDDGGTFSLPHEVLWQNVTVPAGDYRFSLQPMGPSEMLKLSKISGAPASFMILVNDTSVADVSKTASLVIDSKMGQRYVSAMNLPQFEVALHFTTPASSGKPVAEMRTASFLSSSR